MPDIIAHELLNTADFQAKLVANYIHRGIVHQFGLVLHHNKQAHMTSGIGPKLLLNTKGSYYHQPATIFIKGKGQEMNIAGKVISLHYTTCIY